MNDYRNVGIDWSHHFYFHTKVHHKRGTQSCLGRRMMKVLLLIKEIDDATDTFGAKTPVERDGRAEIHGRIRTRNVRSARPMCTHTSKSNLRKVMLILILTKIRNTHNICVGSVSSLGIIVVERTLGTFEDVIAIAS